eukprot:COSAG02_NODE_29909_length_560_cov_1.561822_1_plen_46_part_01
MTLLRQLVPALVLTAAALVRPCFVSLAYGLVGLWLWTNRPLVPTIV